MLLLVLHPAGKVHSGRRYGVPLGCDSSAVSSYLRLWPHFGLKCGIRRKETLSEVANILQTKG